MKLLVILLLLAVAGAQLWIRFAPTDAARWHVRPKMPETGPGLWQEPKGVRAATDLRLPPAEALARFDAVATAGPRTRRIAGSPEEGMATYVTRSEFWGFPDYTTVAAVPMGGGARLAVHGRARYGGSDLGVNADRVRGWLDALTSERASGSG